MAKARKKKKARKAASKRRSVKTAKRKVKAKAGKAPRRKAKRRAKPKQEGLIDAVVGTVEEAAALRRRLVGPESFED